MQWREWYGKLANRPLLWTQEFFVRTSQWLEQWQIHMQEGHKSPFPGQLTPPDAGEMFRDLLAPMGLHIQPQFDLEPGSILGSSLLTCHAASDQVTRVITFLRANTLPSEAMFRLAVESLVLPEPVKDSVCHVLLPCYLEDSSQAFLEALERVITDHRDHWGEGLDGPGSMQGMLRLLEGSEWLTTLASMAINRYRLHHGDGQGSLPLVRDPDLLVDILLDEDSSQKSFEQSLSLLHEMVSACSALDSSPERDHRRETLLRAVGSSEDGDIDNLLQHMEQDPSSGMASSLHDAIRILREPQDRPTPRTPPSTGKDSTPEELWKQCEDLKGQANSVYSQGDLEEAIQLYSAGLALVPHHPVLLANRAAAYLRVEEPEKALQDCQTFLSLREEEVTAALQFKVYLRLASALYSSDRIEEALAAISSCYWFQSGLGENDWALLCRILARCSSAIHPALSHPPWLPTWPSSYSTGSLASSSVRGDLWVGEQAVGEAWHGLFVLPSGRDCLPSIRDLLFCHDYRWQQSQSTYSSDRFPAERVSSQWTLWCPDLASAARSLFVLNAMMMMACESYQSSSPLEEIQMDKARAERVLHVLLDWIDDPETLPWLQCTDLLDLCGPEEEHASKILYFQRRLQHYWQTWLRQIHAGTSSSRFGDDLDAMMALPLWKEIHQSAKKLLCATRRTGQVSAEEWKATRPRHYQMLSTIQIQCLPLASLIPSAANPPLFDLIHTGPCTGAPLAQLAFLRPFLQSTGVMWSAVEVPSSSTTQQWKDQFEDKYQIPFGWCQSLLHLQSDVDVAQSTVLWSPSEIVPLSKDALESVVEDLWELIIVDSRSMETQEEGQDDHMNSDSFWMILQYLQWAYAHSTHEIPTSELLENFFIELAEHDSIYALSSCLQYHRLANRGVSDWHALSTPKLSEVYILQVFSEPCMLHCFVEWHPSFAPAQLQKAGMSSRCIILSCLLSQEVVRHMQGEELYDYLTEEAIGRDMQVIDSFSYDHSMNLLTFSYPLPFLEPQGMEGEEEDDEEPVKAMFFLLDQTSYAHVARPLQVFRNPYQAIKEDELE